jgi:hypothetical protein
MEGLQAGTRLFHFALSGNLRMSKENTFGYRKPLLLQPQHKDNEQRQRQAKLVIRRRLKLNYVTNGGVHWIHEICSGILFRPINKFR